MTTDPMDQPEVEGMELVFPFVACASNGGPYDDSAFTAGYQCGLIDRALATMATVGAATATYTVYSTLVKQLDLIGMARGYSLVLEEPVEDLEEWSYVTFEASGDSEVGGR